MLSCFILIVVTSFSDTPDTYEVNYTNGTTSNVAPTNEKAMAKHNEKHLEDLVDGAVLSYQVHSVKPHLGIYKELLNKYNLNPSESIFIDDRKANIDTANKLGIIGVKVKPNSYEDVASMHKVDVSVNDVDEEKKNSPLEKFLSGSSEPSTPIIGFRNYTDHAGATTLIYMLKKELTLRFGHDNVIAIEVDKNDFQLFGEKSMVSTREGDIIRTVSQYSNVDILLIDLNKCQDDSFCTDIVYLVEPSTVRLNGLVRKHKDAFTKIKKKKVVLNQSMLLNNDIFDFESEAGIKVFYNLPPLDERKKNSVILDFATKLGLLSGKASSGGSNKIFGLFRR